MTEAAQIIFTALFWIVIPTSLLLWVRYLQKLGSGLAPVPREDRDEVPWQVIDLLGIAFVVGVSIIVATSLVADAYEMSLDSRDNWTAEQHLALIFGSSCAILAGSFIGLFVIWIRVRATASDFGFSLGRISYDFSLGLSWFIMLIVPVTLTQFSLTKLFPAADQHPFIEIIVSDPNPRYIIMVAVAAILIAPFCEEFLFRVILQGWLEKLQHHWRDAILHSGESLPILANENIDDAEPLESDAMPPHNSDEYGEIQAETNGTLAAAAEATGQSTNWLPIFISSAAFSAAHIGHGPAPVSLFFLALGLGYLYQKTRRIWACLVVHMLVNSLAVLQLLLLVKQLQDAQ